MRIGAKARIQYSLARLLLGFFAVLPRTAADASGRLVARIGYRFARGQRQVAFRNLELALPDLPDSERRRIVRGVFDNLGRLLVEFSRFPKLTGENVTSLVEYKGLSHYTEALARGKGVLVLTAHVGAWELSCYAHSVYGYSMKFLTRPIDNPLIEALVARYRTLGGNGIIRRTDAARGVLQALANNEAVGILIDQNTTESEGVFADFFGIPAATTSGLAKFALRTDAAVVPGFIRWEAQQRKHVLEFRPQVELIRTGDRAADVVANTSRFNRIVEDYVRRYPDQWNWIHKRWKTRPHGEPSLY